MTTDHLRDPATRAKANAARALARANTRRTTKPGSETCDWRPGTPVRVSRTSPTLPYAGRTGWVAVVNTQTFEIGPPARRLCGEFVDAEPGVGGGSCVHGGRRHVPHRQGLDPRADLPGGGHWAGNFHCDSRGHDRPPQTPHPLEHPRRRHRRSRVRPPEARPHRAGRMTFTEQEADGVDWDVTIIHREQP